MSSPEKQYLAISWDNIVSSLKGCHIIIDGKKLRGENPISCGCNGLYILNTMVSDYEICVAEERVDDKTNELTVLPSVIASLCIVRALVYVDAMGTHCNIAQQIIMQDANYLMTLKDNQPILKDLIETYLKLPLRCLCLLPKKRDMDMKKNGSVPSLTLRFWNKKECMSNGPA